MTATKTERVRSDNSVSHEATVTPENDPRLQRIAQLANRPDGLATRNDITAESGWLLEELDECLEWLHQGNYVQLLEERETTIVLLTGRGEALVGGII